MDFEDQETDNSIEDTDSDTENESDIEEGEEDAAAGGERRRAVVAWEYEPLPVGEPGENLGDAEPAQLVLKIVFMQILTIGIRFSF